MKRTGFIDARRLAGFTLSGAQPLTGVNLVINDISVPTSGYVRGLRIAHAVSGVSSRYYTAPLSIEFTITGVTGGQFWAQYVNMSVSADPTMSYYLARYVYMADPGSNCGEAFVDRLNLSAIAAGISGFWSLRNIGAVELTCIMKFESNNTALYLIDAVGAGQPFTVGAPGGSEWGRLRIRYLGAEKWLKVFE